MWLLVRQILIRIRGTSLRKQSPIGQNPAGRIPAALPQARLQELITCSKWKANPRRRAVKASQRRRAAELAIEVKVTSWRRRAAGMGNEVKVTSGKAKASVIAVGAGVAPEVPKGGTVLQQGNEDPQHGLQTDQEDVTHAPDPRSDQGGTHHHQTDIEGAGRLQGEEDQPAGLGLPIELRGVGTRHCLQIGLEEEEGLYPLLGLQLELESVNHPVQSLAHGLQVLQGSTKLLLVALQQSEARINISLKRSAAALDGDDKQACAKLVIHSMCPTALTKSSSECDV